MNAAYSYTPHGAARDLFHCQASEIAFEGPAGTGKTRAVLQKIHAICEALPIRALLLREYRIALNETVLVTYETKVLPRGHSALSGPDRSHRQRYRYANGAEVILGGMDAPERFMSGEYDIAALFEATDVRDESKWEMVLSRLRNNVLPYQQGICDLNPSAPSHWLNDRPERNRVDGSPVMVRMLSRHADNPSLTPEYLDLLRNLTGTRRARLYEGKWVAAEGLIYDFDRSRHVRVVDTSLWPRTIVGADDGTHNPCAMLRVRISGDGNIHVEREAYKSGLLESSKVASARELAQGAESIQLDPAAAGLMLALRTCDLPSQPADNEVLGGIAKVQDRFAQDRISIDPSCVNLIRELEGYEWRDNAKKDEPVKENDHACDALRYIVARIDKASVSRVHVGMNKPVITEEKSSLSFNELRKDEDWGWETIR